ncbi:hypothetical protein H0H93_003709 [Arthromyces matolae]|nr:hypothetical protein H0H93_003709 [Arthromyces matolae]
MDSLFENCPVFVPGSSYAKVGDRNAGERELREGKFAPGEMSEKEVASSDPENASDHKEL